MPDRIISAEAVISAKDATGDVFVNIARKLGEIGKGAKASAEVERLSKTLSDAARQAEKIGQFRTASKSLDTASLAMAKAKQNAGLLAQQIAGLDKPTATLTGKLSQAEKEVTRATDAFKRQGQAVREARGALDAAGIPLSKLGTEQTRLKGVIEGTTRALERQIGVEREAAEMAAKVAEAEKREAAARAQAERVAERAAHQRQHDIAHHGIGNYVAGAAAGAVSAHGVMTALEKALEAGAERQTTIIGMKNAGMKDDEIQRAVDLATKVSRNAPNLDVSQILELHKEARSGVSHPEEAFELMPDLARATSVLKGMGANNANIADIVKGGESLGLMNDPHRFHAYLDAQVRSMKVMGKTITTEQIYEAAKYSKAAGGTLSDDFLNLTMPSLIQEMHGSSAGDALSSLTKTLRGGLQHKHVPVTKLQELGLLDDPSQIRRSKTGEILGYTGKVKGDDLLATDPDRWFLEYFDKAAETHGYTKLADKTKLLSETLPGTAANLGRIVIQQRESLTQHRQNYRDAPNLERSVELQAHDPKVAMQTFTAALNDLEAAVTGPAMDTLSLGLGKLSGVIRDLADAAKAHPDIAMSLGAGAAAAGLAGSGVLAYYVSTGFGLPAAATELSASALALEAAAAKMGVGGAAGGAVNAAENAAGGAVGSMGWFGKLATGFGIAGAGIFVGDAMLNRRDHDKAMIEGGHPDVKPWDNNLGLPGVDTPSPSAAPEYHAPSAYDREVRARRATVDPAPSPTFWHRIFGAASEPAEQAGDRLALLGDRSGIVLTSFDGLNGGAGALNATFGTLGVGTGGLKSSLDILAQTAIGAARALATVALGGGSGEGGGGGSGLIRASYGGGGADDGSPVVGGAGTVDKSLPREARAFLDTISSGEAHGYNVLNGGGTFGDLSRHPGGRAAGRYQDLPSTWRRISGALGLHDFSPASQDKGNWWLAQQDYRTKTGRDLLADLRTRDPGRVAAIGRALHSTWVSTNGSFSRKFDHFLGAQPGSDEHPALKAPAPHRGQPAAAHATTARLEEKLDRVASALETGGSLHRIEVTAGGGASAKKTYSRSRGSVGPTMVVA